MVLDYFIYLRILSFSFPAAVQKIAPDSRITLGCNFSRHHGKVVWGVSDIRVTAQVGIDNWINVQRHLKPAASLGDRYQVLWRKIINGTPPWNGVARNDNGVTKITGVMPTPAGDATLRYSMFYARVGQQPQATMKSALHQLMQHLKAHEASSRLASSGH